MPQMPPVTKTLMLICVGLFCVFLLVPPQVSAWFELWPLGTGNFWPWQLFTYAFLHGSIGHLFFNMLGLWMFGSELEQLWGPKRYMQMLAASVLSAALAQLAFTYLIDSGNPTVGASGALFGLLLSFGMLFPNRIIMPLFPPIPMKAKYFVAVFGALELFLGLGGGGGIAHFAHLGGMLGAYLLIRYWRSGRSRRR